MYGFGAFGGNWDGMISDLLLVPGSCTRITRYRRLSNGDACDDDGASCGPKFFADLGFPRWRLLTNTQGIDFSTDGVRVDRDWLWDELIDHAYWAKYRSREMFEQQLDSAWRVVGAYRVTDGQMVGFCRAFSDGVAMAYLADVYVSPQERGRGVGQGLLRVMIDEGSGRGFRWMLHTVDAQGLYEKFGFSAPDATFMERGCRLPHVRP